MGRIPDRTDSDPVLGCPQNTLIHRERSDGGAHPVVPVHGKQRSPVKNDFRLRIRGGNAARNPLHISEQAVEPVGADSAKITLQKILHHERGILRTHPGPDRQRFPVVPERSNRISHISLRLRPGTSRTLLRLRSGVPPGQSPATKPQARKGPHGFRTRHAVPYGPSSPG